MLSYHLDESPERIREVLLKQATGIKSKQAELDTAPWFALHRFVSSGPVSVEIPFAEKLAKAPKLCPILISECCEISLRSSR